MKLTPISRFWRLLSHYNIELREIYTYAVFSGLVNLTLPLGIQAIINYLQTGQLTSAWIVLVSFVLLGITANGLLQVLQLRIVENIQQDLFARSAFEFAMRIPKIAFKQLNKMHAPELINRFFDTLTIQKAMPKILIDFSLAVFQIVFGLILLTIYSPFFVILAFVFFGLLFLIIRLTGPKGLETSLLESKYKYRLAHWLEEIGRVNRTFKLNASTYFHLDHTDGLVKDYLKHREGHFKVLYLQFQLFIVFKIIVAAFLLLLGGFLVFQEQMNVGQFVAAEIVIILIISSVEKLLMIIESIYDLLTALEKIGFVTDMPLDKNTGQISIGSHGGHSIRAEEMKFGFDDASQRIFNGISFEIKAGEKVLLDGPSGSGKTLLLQILAGIYEIESGQIYVSDIPLHNYDKAQYYHSLGVSFPTNQIFEGTIRDNILVGRQASQEELMEVIDLIGLRKHVVHQENGLDTFIDSAGRRLPRSFIQKIHIARILLHKPKLLLLEDPLQFLPVVERNRIIDYIMSPDRPWTCLVVSDHSHWEDVCDKILDLSSPDLYA